MKIGAKIKIIASFPRVGQCGIEDLVGKEFQTVKAMGECSKGEIAIYSPEFEGQIILNEFEYEKI